MVSRRNYFNITIMMIVLLFMFQFPEFIKESGNDYDTNEYLKNTDLNAATAWKVNEEPIKSGNHVAFFGPSDSAVCAVINEWCTYTKRNLLIYADLNDFHIEAGVMPEVILLEPSVINDDADVQLLERWVKEGMSLIFCGLPDTGFVRRSLPLRELMGIRFVNKMEQSITGVYLFKGFLLGGDIIYQANTEEEQKRQDLAQVVPWFQAAGGTKVYMVGLIDDADVENEELPMLIWRNSIERSRIFVVNGNYMEDISGIGILDAMMAEMNSYEIYPVINAQNVTVANYPGFSNENEETVMDIYSHNQQSLYRDIIWPGLLSTMDRVNLKMTCFLMPQYDYSDDEFPNSRDYTFYLKQLKEQEGEAGLSMETRTDMSLAEKAEKDDPFYSALNGKYKYGALYLETDQLPEADQLPNVRYLKSAQTLTCAYTKERPLVSYCTNNMTLQMATHNARLHTYGDNLRLRSLETALGYSNILLDMNNVVWPETDDDKWENYYEELSSNVLTYWSQFSYFSQTTLSESDQHIRTFLALDYEDSRKDNTIRLTITNRKGDAWFILRTNNERIAKISGGRSEELEEGAFLICAEEDTVEIQVEKILMQK